MICGGNPNRLGFTPAYKPHRHTAKADTARRGRGSEPHRVHHFRAKSKFQIPKTQTNPKFQGNLIFQVSPPAFRSGTQDFTSSVLRGEYSILFPRKHLRHPRNLRIKSMSNISACPEFLRIRTDSVPPEMHFVIGVFIISLSGHRIP